MKGNCIAGKSDVSEEPGGWRRRFAAGKGLTQGSGFLVCPDVFPVRRSEVPGEVNVPNFIAQESFHTAFSRERGFAVSVVECGVFGQPRRQKAVAAFGVGVVWAEFFLSRRKIRPFVEVRSAHRRIFRHKSARTGKEMRPASSAARAQCPEMPFAIGLRQNAAVQHRSVNQTNQIVVSVECGFSG